MRECFKVSGECVENELKKENEKLKSKVDSLEKLIEAMKSQAAATGENENLEED